MPSEWARSRLTRRGACSSHPGNAQLRNPSTTNVPRMAVRLIFMPSRNEGPNVNAPETAGRDSASVASESDVTEQLHMYQTMFELGSLGQLIVDYRSFRIR